MCTVSMVGDHFNEKWKEPYYDDVFNKLKLQQPLNGNVPTHVGITREEFNALKKEVEDMKALLIRAKEYDEKNNEPHCEMETKVAKLKEIAQLMGIDLTEIFK